MLHNPVVDQITNHRSIRKFKDQTLTAEQLQTLYAAASQTSTSMFMQQFSILHVTDEKLREGVRNISGQPYIGANGDLFVFVVDLTVTNRSASSWVRMMAACTRPTSSSKPLRTRC